jgi:hypothetical protein
MTVFVVPGRDAARMYDDRTRGNAITASRPGPDRQRGEQAYPHPTVGPQRMAATIRSGSASLLPQGHTVPPLRDTSGRPCSRGQVLLPAWTLSRRRACQPRQRSRETRVGPARLLRRRISGTQGRMCRGRPCHPSGQQSPPSSTERMHRSQQPLRTLAVPVTAARPGQETRPKDRAGGMATGHRRRIHKGVHSRTGPLGRKPIDQQGPAGSVTATTGTNTRAISSPTSPRTSWTSSRTRSNGSASSGGGRTATTSRSPRGSPWHDRTSSWGRSTDRRDE